MKNTNLKREKNLKSGNVLECVSGNIFLCTDSDIYINLQKGHLCHASINNEVIIKIYKDYTLQEIIWEKKKIPNLTEAERHILLSLSAEFRTDGYIARDEDETLGIYLCKPFKGDYIPAWEYDDTSSFSKFKRFDLFNHLFNFVQWSDKEPWSIAELLGEE